MKEITPGACRKVCPFSHTFLLPPPTTYDIIILAEF